MNLAISFNPTNRELDQIEKWLIEERATSGEGFYCNWSIIKNFYDRNELGVLLVDDQAVGFACWRKTSEFTGQINIFEIKPDLRNKGLGTYFTKQIQEHFFEKNTYVIDLQCVPENSEIFWRKFEFQDVPSNIHYWDRQTVHLFKPLVRCAQGASHRNANDYIEMWDNEPYATKNKEPNWIWHIRINNENQLSLPIIQPCEKDWRIRLVRDNKVVLDDKIKRFGNVEIDHGPYAIITEVPETQ